MVRIAGALARGEHGFGAEVNPSGGIILERAGTGLNLDHVHNLEILGGEAAAVGHTDLPIDISFVGGRHLEDGDRILRGARFTEGQSPCVR